MRTNRGPTLSAAVVLLLLGCNGESPTSPTAQPPSPVARMGVVSGNVHTTTGACLVGAVVEVMDGPRAGARFTQTACQGAFDYGDDGYSFRDLPSDVNVRLRASKAGYQSQELTVNATTGAVTQSNFVLAQQ